MKFIQILALLEEDCTFDVMYALDDEGHVWRRGWETGEFLWEQDEASVKKNKQEEA